MSHTTVSAPAIEIRGLTKSFGAVQALRGLDLTVAPGQVFGFLGPNGAGKTTALSILAGLSHPSGGSAWIGGHDVVNEGMAVRRRIGFLRQDPRFYNWMSGLETLEFTGRFFADDATEIRRRADQLLELVDLQQAASRKVGGYSGGMRQRLGIAQALMGDPEVLLLDEPCSALDPAGRYEVIQIMERLRGRTTVFYSTHILQDVERVADEVAIIRSGQCVRQASMTELLAASEDTLVIEFEGPPHRVIEDLRRQDGVTNVVPIWTGGPMQRLRVHVRDLEAARRSLPLIVVGEEDVIFVGSRPEQRSLEDVFLELTDGESGDIKR